MNKFFFRIFIFFAFLFSFFSCENQNPEVILARGTTIFDFADFESFPSVRLAVFSNLKSDGRRTASLTVSGNLNDYVWRVFDAQVFTSGGNYWSGYANLSVADGEKIPKGRYSLEYKDFSGETDSVDFLVSYPDEILTAKAADAPNFLSTAKEEKIALYDENGILVYFDQKKSHWTDWQKIKLEYSQSVKSRIVFCEGNMSVMILLPFENEEHEIPGEEEFENAENN